MGKLLLVMYMMESNLKFCREELEMTQTELGYIFGVSKGTVANWENGYSSPTMDKATKLAYLYDMPVEHMDFSKEGNRQPSKEEIAVILARKLEPDTISIPEEIEEGVTENEGE